MDKVRFQAHERLDLVDANALQELIYEYMGQAFGGLMGNSAGALTAIEYDSSFDSASSSYFIHLKPFQYYWSQPEVIESVMQPNGISIEVPKRYRGQVISYNPADESETEADSIEWTSFRTKWLNATTTAGTHTPSTDPDGTHGGIGPYPPTVEMPILWARPKTVDTGTDARREWSVADQVEKPITIKTRTRIRSSFKLQTERPPLETNTNQWVAIARVVAWNFETQTATGTGGRVPDGIYLAPIYVWDNHFFCR